MFFLTMLYKDRAQTVAVWHAFCSRAISFPVHTGINKTGLLQISLLCYKIMFIRVCMDVAQEHASSFRFRFRVKPEIIELQIVPNSFNRERGGSKLLHGIRNVH
jgi:hypothetical protein